MAFEPDAIFRTSDLNNMYTASGSKVVMYGLFDPVSKNWWTGNRNKWAGAPMLLPSALMHSLDEAGRVLVALDNPPDTTEVVKVLAVYLPISAEDTDGSVRQEVDGEGSVGVERTVE